MILKFVYGKEIHLYDLKQDESFDHACEKIRGMFKGLPQEFVLTYRNSEQLELEIDSNQQMDQLINDLKPNAKMVKLYITDITDRKLNPNLQADQNMAQQNHSQALNLQEENINYKQVEQESVRFTDLNQPHEETQNSPQSQYQRIQSQEKREFQQLDSSDEEENEVQRQVKNYLREKIENICVDDQRQQLDTNIQHENSNPHQMLNLGQSKQQEKETFDSQLEEKPEAVIQAEPMMIKVEEKVNEVNAHNVDLLGGEKLTFSQRKKIFQPYQPKQRSQVEDIRCHRAKCDMCQVAPIIGVRYKCVVCPDYDLCQKCEQHHSHQHPLLKICFTYQTPITINVQIPSFNQKIQQQQPQIVLQRFDFSKLDVEQRKQRISTIASELSDLLDIDFHQCFKFIRQNQQYTKESLTQLMISKKDGKQLMREKTAVKSKKEQKSSGINGILSNVKGLFSSFISN